VYATFYNRTLETIRPTAAAIVDGESYLDLLSRHKVHFFGNGADKCRAVITHPNALFVEDIHPLATGMVPLAEQAFNEKRFVDSAYFEPHYLKEFVATVAKNKIIPTAR